MWKENMSPEELLKNKITWLSENNEYYFVAYEGLGDAMCAVSKDTNEVFCMNMVTYLRDYMDSETELDPIEAEELLNGSSGF